MRLGAANPRLSVIAAGRNDDYGGNFIHRFSAFLLNVIELLEWCGIPYEVIIVEWNPPRNRPFLDEALGGPPIALRRGRVRFIQVPAEVHAMLPNSDRIPLFEYVAKNVGIRRASGEFVLVTNPDVIMSRGLALRVGRDALCGASYYRTARYDVRGPVPLGSVEAMVKYCRQNIVRVHGYWYSCEWRLGARLNPYRRARAVLSYARWMIWNRSVINPYTNAAGDFFLMRRDRWFELRGYPELKTHSFIDGYMAYMAHFAGLKLRILRGRDVFLYHQDHGREESSGRPWTAIEEYFRNCRQMARDRRPLIFNGEEWGLGALDLPERCWGW